MTITRAITKEEEQKLAKQTLKEGYVKRVLIGFDQFVNVVAGGHPDETISARSGRAAQSGKLWGKAMCGFLNLFQKNHGVQAEVGDMTRADKISSVENKAIPVKNND